MTGIKRVVRALGTFRKTREPVLLSERKKPVRPAGEEFVRIALMAYVPYDFIVRRLKYPVQRDSQLDDAEIGRKMAAVFGNRVKNHLANITGKP